jgi:sec-independent protein translocase protein TatC
MERKKIIAFLTDLRGVMLKSLGVVVISGGISFIYAKDIIRLLLNVADLRVYYLSLPEVFYTTVDLALYGGVFFAFPIIIYLIWHELKGTLGIKPIYGYLFIFFAIVLFYGGSLFCYRFVLPSGIKFLLSYEGGAIRAMISVERFVLFCAAMIFAFGITFEIPIIMMALGKIGIVKSQSLSKTRRYAVLVVILAAALITPTPDVYNMMLLAVPMYFLYEAGIVLMRIVEKKDVPEEGAVE